MRGGRGGLRAIDGYRRERGRTALYEIDPFRTGPASSARKAQVSRVGPSGVGKSRLAIRIATDLAHAHH